MLDYLNRIERGESVDREAFLAQHVEIVNELRPLIERDAQARQAAKRNSPNTASLAQGGNPKPRSSAKAEVTTHSAVGAVQQTMASQTTPAASGSQSSGSKSADLPPEFGRYQIQKKLGSGAMGAVYLAEDSSLGRLVAIKTPTFENDSDGELLRRFHREARAVASLKHPGLCAVYEVGTIDGRHYISMEFVAGRKLSDCIKSEKLMTEKQAMAVVRKIALAMHEAHLHGVIHRDLKPDNIMINEKGDPVVMDFGLVHKTESKDSTKLTQHGTLIGSPAYMSKEQVEGDPDKLTAATDQYSLGVVLYQLLTSKLPFEGGLHAVLGAILTREPPPPSSHRPDLNPNLEAVCLKMMAKEAKDRFPSMKAAAEALADVARGTSTLAGNPVAGRAKRNSQNNEAMETTLEVMPDAEVGDADDFDFKSPLVSSPDRKPQHRKKSNSPNVLLIGGISAGVLLLAAIIWFQFGNTQVKVEVLADGFDVKFNEAGITVSDGTSETKVKPGQHTLHITSIKPGANGTVEEFDTEQLTLKKGGKPVVSVSIENGAAVAKLDGKVIPRRSLTTSSTGKFNTTSSIPNESIDLLSRVDLAQHTVSGKWIRVGEVLISPKERNACVVLPMENIPESYQLTVQAERVSGNNNLSLFLVLEGKEAQVALDSNFPSGICSGLNVLNNQQLDLNSTAWRKQVLPEGKEVTIVATVRPGHIQIECDRQKIIDWKGSSSSLSHDRYWTAALPQGKLCLGSWDSAFKISRISLLPLRSTQSTTFVDWDLAQPGGEAKWTILDDGVLHGSGRGWLATKRDYSDFEMALEYQLPSGGNSGVFLRATPTGNPDGTEFLKIQLQDDKDPNNRSTALVTQTGSLFGIAARKQAVNTAPNRWHALLVRAVGPDIRVTHDGVDCLSVNLQSETIPATIKSLSRGRIGLQSHRSTAGVKFRNISIRDLPSPAGGSQSTTAAPKTDYDAIATGKWIRLVDATTTLPDPARMKFKNDVLELDSTTLHFNNVAARNVIVRAKILKVSGKNCGLTVREAMPFYFYSGYFSGGNRFGIGKVGRSPWSDLYHETSGPVRNSFFEMAVSMVEETITIYADGKAIYSGRDTEHQRGAVALIANSGVSLFKDVEVMVLDKPLVVVPPAVGVTDLDRIATGKWLPLIDASTPLSNPARMRLLEGGLRLEDEEFISRGITARNVVVRADVRETYGENVNLVLRSTGPDNNPKSFAVIYNCESSGVVEIGRIENNSWFPTNSTPVDRKILPDQFVNIAFSAIGNTLTAYVDGRRVLEAQTSDPDSGGIRLRSFKGIHLFKNVEYQILDSMPATTPAPAAALPKLTSLAELNTPGDDTAAWVSADGRRIYWQQNLTSIDDSKMWQAERASPTEPFGNKVLIADGEQPTLAPDELQMVFIRRDATRTKRLYAASRKSITDKFEAAVELTQFGNNLIFNSPFITADGLSLFMNSRPASRISVTDGGYNVARRAKVTDAWPPMTPFRIEWNAVAQKAPLTWIAMEPDELSFLATHELDIGQFRILRFTRSRKSNPFAKYEYLSLPGMPVVYGRSPRYIAATRELFLTAPADYASSNSLAGWQTGNHNLWVIRDVTFSTTFVDPATTQKGAIRAADVPIPAIAPFSVVQARKHQEEWALYLKAPVEHENSVGIKTVLIPPGEFIMGRLPGEAARFPRNGLYQEPATTQHKVTLTRPFRMGTTEVTRRQWRDVMGSEPWRGKDKGPEGDDYPANYTTKTAAKEFCKRLSEKEGKTYRLPTEAEWEFACRAGSVTLYFFGENHAQVGEYACKGGLQTVATKKPNPWGLFDMYGNLWEWVADGRTAFTSEAAVDPLLNPSDAQSIIRGSCFRSVIPAEFSSGARHSWPGTLPTDEKGFRIVCEADR